MQVAGIRRIGARVEMIEVGEPRPLAADEVLLQVMAAGVGNWDEFVRTGGWDVGATPPMALGVEAAGTVLAAGQAAGGWAARGCGPDPSGATARPGHLGAAADRPGRAARPQTGRCHLGRGGRLP